MYRPQKKKMMRRVNVASVALSLVLAGATFSVVQARLHAHATTTSALTTTKSTTKPTTTVTTSPAKAVTPTFHVVRHHGDDQNNFGDN